MYRYKFLKNEVNILVLKVLCNILEDKILIIFNNNCKNLKGLYVEMFYIM